MTTTFTICTGNEVYVYVCGVLVLKRWQPRNAWALFQVAPGFTYWWVDR